MCKHEIINTCITYPFWLNRIYFILFIHLFLIFNRRRKRLITQHAGKLLRYLKHSYFIVIVLIYSLNLRSCKKACSKPLGRFKTANNRVLHQKKAFASWVSARLTQGSQMLSLSSCLVHFSLCKCCLPENNVIFSVY